MTKNRDVLAWDPELTDREIHLIGKIVVLWGALEHEVFLQTILAFGTQAKNPNVLPKAMNNLQFTGLLTLWNERVITAASSSNAVVLKQVYNDVLRLKDFRDAIIHGMWSWSTSNLSVIQTSRVKKRQVISANFTADDLQDFYMQLGRINFKLRYPGGIEGLARARAQEGGYVSRRFLSAIGNHPVAKEWLSGSMMPRKMKKRKRGSTA